ncbi:MAG: hypothetical protein U0838_14685 [Chloroflexota bacterium]
MDIRPLTVALWPALADLFSAGGDPKWCWCQCTVGTPCELAQP